METLHGSFGSSFLQWINDLLFEGTPVIEGFDPEEVNQREELLNLILAVAEISNLGRARSIQVLHRSACKAPTVSAFELETSLRTLGRPVLNRVRLV